MMLGQLRKRVFGISPQEASPTQRGFEVSDDTKAARLEQIGQTFIAGYHAALLDPAPAALVAQLDEIPLTEQGFAYEGVGMGLALLDILTPWPSHRLRRFLDGPGQPHAFMIQIGVGWALARLHRPIEGWLNRLDPVVNWLALDGYGFHEGYFNWPRYIEQQTLPPRLSGYARRGFDQGLGRCLWFVKGADVGRVVGALNSFPVARQGDLWSGVGLACAYAGAVERSEVEDLAQAAGPCFPQLAQGVMSAAATRQKAGNPVPHSEMASQVICGMSLAEATARFDQTGQDLPVDGPDEPAFEVWRQRMQAEFMSRKDFVGA